VQLEDRISAVRAFNRLWTARIGLLADHLHDTPFSLTEARVIFELAQRSTTEVSTLRKELVLDAGYLSRILTRFKRDRIVKLQHNRADARRRIASLTSEGLRAYRRLSSRSEKAVERLLKTLTDDQQQRLINAMHEIERVLANRPRQFVILRPPRAGDLGWIVERHGALYAREYAWNEEFEALVARIVGDYVAKRDPQREAAWIAELDGDRVGCVLCVRKNASTAQLRLLLVDPTARGHGIGRKLVDECIDFARDRGYKRMVLWTNDVLHSARRIYEAAGFTLASSGKHHAFGHDLVEQTWELSLT